MQKKYIMSTPLTAADTWSFNLDFWAPGNKNKKSLMSPQECEHERSRKEGAKKKKEMSLDFFVKKDT